MPLLSMASAQGKNEENGVSSWKRSSPQLPLGKAAAQFAAGFLSGIIRQVIEYHVLNDVVFNQVLIKCDTPEKTTATLKNIQSSGKCWCGGAVWNDEPVIRISVCSWQTTRQDIDECVEVFIQCREDS